ncbi:hypothetical protein ACFWIB_30730 [Streptomyces sp. NPDC127051]|uniref:lipase family protein n=1 Tax=Streptomyces sp. NPDC127051 TaxID=3347119 RepID=UPI003646030A
MSELVSCPRSWRAHVRVGPARVTGARGWTRKRTARTAASIVDFAVVIRGTVGNVPDLLEDLDVGTVVPFNLVGMPSPVPVSKGAMKAFTEVVTMSTAGVTLAQALTTALGRAQPNPTVCVTGHSLGGCIATMVAPYLQTLTWSNGRPNFELHTFAAPTAGGEEFAAYVDSLAWQANERDYNMNDLVPQAWNNLAVAHQWYPSPPGPAADDDVKAVISALAGWPGGLPTRQLHLPGPPRRA